MLLEHGFSKVRSIDKEMQDHVSQLLYGVLLQQVRDTVLTFNLVMIFGQPIPSKILQCF